MKKQQHTEVYLDGMDTPTQYVSAYISRNGVEGLDISQQHHGHMHEPNGQTEQMVAQMGASEHYMPTGYAHPATNSGSGHVLGYQQPESFDHQPAHEAANAYQREILLGQMAAYGHQNVHMQQITEQVDNYGAATQPSMGSSLYPAPVDRPQTSTERPRRRLRTVVGLLSLLLVAGGIAWGIMNLDSILASDANLGMPATGIDPNDEDEAALLVVEEAEDATIIAKAFVRPARRANLSLAIAGLVTELHVPEGAAVKQGESLLTLDRSQQVVAVAQAKADLSQAQARLDELTAGSRSEEILAAQAVVDSAKAQLASLQEGISAEDEQAAVAQVRSAEANLNALYQDPKGEAVIAAKAELKNTEAALSRAQNAYNEVKWQSNIGMLPQSEDLQTATNNFEASQARLNALFAAPTTAQVSQAQAQVSDSQAALQRLRRPNKKSDIAAAEAEVRRAEADLRLLQSGTRSEVLAFAQAELDAAEARLLEAEVGLARTDLKAPFDGTIVALDTEVGEYLQPGFTVAQLGDLDHWILETDDLIELDIINVAEGASVRITIDSMPELDLTGTVARVRRIGENKVGDITYTVYIKPDRHVLELAWNMTASVHIGQ